MTRATTPIHWNLLESIEQLIGGALSIGRVRLSTGMTLLEGVQLHQRRVDALDAREQRHVHFESEERIIS